MGVWRRILCLVAALLVASTGVLAAIDRSFTLSPEVIIGGLFIMAIAAAALATWPSGADWSQRRRRICAVVALGWLLLSQAVLLLTIVRTGFISGPGGPAYVPPAPLGIDTRQLIFFAVVTGLTLLLIAAALPRRDADEAQSVAIEEA